MTEPTGLVQVPQSELDGFTAQINTLAAEINAAVGVLGPYITTLLANATPQLPEADVANLTTAMTGLTAAGTALDALEPPTPAP
jgi:hypothetical protein